MSDILYFSRLLLSARSRQARVEIANPYELHRTLSRAFPDGETAEGAQTAWDEARCLFRIEEETTAASDEATVPVIVQTQRRPDWSHHEAIPGYLVGAVAVRELKCRDADGSPLIATGSNMTFRLVANPTVKRDGKRLGLYKEEERLRWIERKARENGFRITDVRLRDRGAVRCVTTKTEASAGHQVVFSAAQFDGALQVVDESTFSRAWVDGVGAGKGIGFGLLSVAPSR